MGKARTTPLTFLEEMDFYRGTTTGPFHFRPSPVRISQPIATSRPGAVAEALEGPEAGPRTDPQSDKG
jgi:hypothetical protein